MANQKIPTIFAKVGDVTGQHYDTRNSEISPPSPHGLGSGDVRHFRLNSAMKFTNGFLSVPISFLD